MIRAAHHAIHWQLHSAVWWLLYLYCPFLCMVWIYAILTLKRWLLWPCIWLYGDFYEHWVPKIEMLTVSTKQSMKTSTMTMMIIPQGSWTQKTVHTVFFEPYKFLKGWDQASVNYIQHVYSYSTLSNCLKFQHCQGNKLVNTIDVHQWSLYNPSENDAMLGDYVDSWLEWVVIWHIDAKYRTTLMQVIKEACGMMR